MEESAARQPVAAAQGEVQQARPPPQRARNSLEPVEQRNAVQATEAEICLSCLRWIKRCNCSRSQRDTAIHRTVQLKAANKIQGLVRTHADRKAQRSPSAAPPEAAREKKNGSTAAVLLVNLVSKPEARHALPSAATASNGGPPSAAASNPNNVPISEAEQRKRRQRAEQAVSGCRPRRQHPRQPPSPPQRTVPVPIARSTVPPKPGANLERKNVWFESDEEEEFPSPQSSSMSPIETGLILPPSFSHVKQEQLTQRREKAAAKAASTRKLVTEQRHRALNGSHLRRGETMYSDMEEMLEAKLGLSLIHI
eukprot:TRINITY_DN10775_c0_g1_i4.p2 TRINITY_DN10775_c0_g1~~TRINITY_DN10775_c0_g1_i4.p2  ORF type:complete len:310 (+),score=46.23 TRINITY_DN10775_c0_g1_i4:1306-2235(+)